MLYHLTLYREEFMPARGLRLYAAVMLLALAAAASGCSKAAGDSGMAESRPAASPSSADAPPPPPAGMALIRGGAFRMGRDDGDEYERPAHTVNVKPFYLDRYEVTCEEYQKFVDAAGHPAPRSWPGGRHPPGQGRRPVTDVRWPDAVAFAKWAGKRLPSEEEWEFAARGGDDRLYPWGDMWKQKAANAFVTSARGVVDVGSFTEGTTPQEVYDMIGNAWEWTSSEMKPYPGGQLPRLPAGDLRVIRGGSWREDADVTSTYRAYLQAEGGKDYSATGFRCAQNVTAGAQKQ